MRAGELRCIVCGSEKPSSRPKYCELCAIQTKRRQSRDKKREYRIELKGYDKGDRLEYKKAWREEADWNEYMRQYRKKHLEKIREQNRVASQKHRNKARQ